MNIIEVVESKDRLLQTNLSVKCDVCGETYNSSFDRLFILTYGQCYLCCAATEDENEVDRKATNIFNIL